eukprot:6209375-Pleurochrysis_carterae.AAC.2
MEHVAAKHRSSLQASRIGDRLKHRKAKSSVSSSSLGCVKCSAFNTERRRIERKRGRRCEGTGRLGTRCKVVAAAACEAGDDVGVGNCGVGSGGGGIGGVSDSGGRVSGYVSGGSVSSCVGSGGGSNSNSSNCSRCGDWDGSNFDGNDDGSHGGSGSVKSGGDVGGGGSNGHRRRRRQWRCSSGGSSIGSGNNGNSGDEFGGGKGGGGAKVCTPLARATAIAARQLAGSGRALLVRASDCVCGALRGPARRRNSASNLGGCFGGMERELTKNTWSSHREAENIKCLG